MTDNYIRQKKRRLANKIWAINKKGGKCVKCGEENMWKLIFHHTSKDKNYSISKILDRGYTRTVLENEINKCELLCDNCHKIEHFYNSENFRSFNFKKLCLEYKQKENFHCEHSEHYKNINSDINNISILEFHHIYINFDIDKEHKLFELSNKSDRTYKNGLTKEIKNEIDKCIVYCGCCHNYEHQKENILFYNKYKSEIDYLSDNYISLGSKKEQSINKNKILRHVRKLHNDGLFRRDIIKKIMINFPTLKKDTLWNYYETEYPNENIEKLIIEYIKNNHILLIKSEIIKNAAKIFNRDISLIYKFYNKIYTKEKIVCNKLIL